MNNIYVTRFSDPGCTTLLGTPNTFVPAGCSDKSTTVLYFYKGLTAFYTYTDSTCKTVSQMSYSFSWGPCVVDAKCTKSSISNMFTQYAACYPSRKSIDFASISKKSFGVQPYIVMDSYYDENCGYAPYSRYEYLLNSCFNSTRSVSSFMFTPNGTEAVSYVSWSQFGCTGKNTTSPVYSNSVDCNKKQKLYIFNMNATATITKYVPSTNILNPTSAARNIITNIFLIVILILSH
ncbi:hypothetical protein BDR26DRAFT_54104 [Obelidium mucronatum]|nr:hypothetical protein BDR26DRAFT_54104 [Obelidium mucronatum]